MLREEIIEKISKYFKLTSFEAEKIYNDIFSVIVSGVKQDNIVDVTNFGEFIIKYNKENGDQNLSAYNKTVEFLATSRLEDEINSSITEQNTTSSGISDNIPLVIPPAPVISAQDEISQTFTGTGTTVEPLIISAGNLSRESSSINPVEEEMRKKREEIINRMNKPVEETESKITENSTSFSAPIVSESITEAEHRLDDKASEYTKHLFEYEEVQKEENTVPDAEEKITEEITDKKAEVEGDISQKSFSDYFTTVPEHKTEIGETIIEQPEHIEEKFEQKVVEENQQHVIPPGVVELHNELTGSPLKHEAMTFPTVEAPKTGSISTNGNGNGSLGEYHASDNSYYIWYKDVESNVTDTQNLSYEYELLYQATKEAEYKSKLKIYVTTFIMFFSIVLILLIFSPVIYKLFFKPVEAPPTNTEQIQKEQQQNTEQQNTQQEQQTQNNTNVTPPVTNTQQEQPKQETQEQPKQQTETPKQETQTPKQETETQPKQETKQPTQTPDQKMTGVTKNSLGWTDDKFKVVYVQLENGKFTIQESAWDSDSKATKRISTVGAYNISGLKGSVLKVDLGDKGTWFRARFGEFSSLEEARVKAEELRNKERLKLQASLLFFLFTA